MVHIHVEAHANGIGGHQIIHFTGLIEGNLRIAGARGKCAHDNGGTTALAADHLGDRVDHLGRKGDDGGSARQARQFTGACVGKFGEARTGDEAGAGNQLFQNGSHGAGAEQHGFFQATTIQDPVGENVSTFQVACQLHFINGEKGHAQIRRHGFNRADPIARLGGNDFFFTRDQRDGVVARFQAHAIINFACQQAQWQSDHSAGMGQHTLNRQMGLSGIGGAQHRRDRRGRRICVSAWHWNST